MTVMRCAPEGITSLEFIRKRFGSFFYYICLLVSIYFMFIFMVAEASALQLSVTLRAVDPCRVCLVSHVLVASRAVHGIQQCHPVVDELHHAGDVANHPRRGAHHGGLHRLRWPHHVHLH